MERGKMAEESLETASEHGRILREIESTDTACIGPTLRPLLKTPRVGEKWHTTYVTRGMRADLNTAHHREDALHSFVIATQSTDHTFVITAGVPSL